MDYGDFSHLQAHKELQSANLAFFPTLAVFADLSRDWVAENGFLFVAASFRLRISDKSKIFSITG